MNAPIRSIARAAAAALVIPQILSLSCMSRQGITRDVRPRESAAAETTGSGGALVRSVYCDILVRPVDDDMWARLASAGIFTKGPAPLMHARVPPVTAFVVEVRSTVNAPLVLKNAQLLYGSAVLDAMSAARLGEVLRSPAYSGIDPARMLSPRRIVRETGADALPDYGRDTIELKLDFVPPRDTVMRIVVFEKLPVEARTFRLRIFFSALGGDKSLDIDFARLEFRAGREDAAWKKKKEGAAHDE